MSEPSLRSVVQELLGTSDDVLCIGAKLGVRSPWRELSSIAAAHELRASFVGIVWQPRALRRMDLCLLKTKLHASGKLLVYVESQRTPMALLRSLVERAKHASPEVRDVCESMLSVGLLEPTVYGLGKRGFVVSAQQPAHRNQLDDVFEQPLD